MKAYLSFLLVFSCFVALSHAFCDQPVVVASDGTTYDLSWIIGHKFQVLNEYSDYVVNVTICAALDEYCNMDDCGACGYAPDHGHTCFGAYDGLTVVEPLDGGLGVLITYNDGDNCTGCTDGSTRSTTLKLICNQLLPGGIIQPENTTIISPTEAHLTIVGEWFCNYPSAPVDFTPNVEMPELMVDYYNYYHVCNESLAHMIELKYTTGCEEKCIITQDFTIYRTCGKKLKIDKKKWVQIVLFEDEQCGLTPMGVTYLATDVCYGDVIHNAFECDDEEVQFLDCKFNPFCRNCEVYDSVPTEECNSDGSFYSCVDGRENMFKF